MRISIAELHRRTQAGERLTMVTAYDYTAGRMIEQTDIPLILVGDSLGMVMQGHETTLPVTVDDIVYHCRAVVRATTKALVVADLPFMAYATRDDALRNGARLMQLGGAQSVKLEGGVAQEGTIRALVEAGIPVMGHVGFTPQSVHSIGLRLQGKDVHRAVEVFRDAIAVERAGAWGIVLELVPAPLARAISERLTIPTVGIGAGPDCDGEVQVWHDILGLYQDFKPRHTRRFAELGETAVQALRTYDEDVRSGAFPTMDNAGGLDDAVLTEALAQVDADAGTQTQQKDHA